MINIDQKNVVFMEKLLIKTYRIFFLAVALSVMFM